MHHGPDHRLVARGSIAAGAALTAALTVLPAPSSADPGSRIERVEERVGRLYHQAEIAAERYNTGREELGTARTELRTLRSELQAQQHQVTRLRDRLGAMVAVQAQSSPLDTTSQLLTADDTNAFLSGVATVQAFNDQQAVMVARYRREAARLAEQRGRMDAQVAAIAKDVSDLRETKHAVDARAGQAKSLLGRLKEKRRERIEARLAAHRAARAEARAAREARAAAERAAVEAAERAAQAESTSRSGGDRSASPAPATDAPSESAPAQSAPPSASGGGAVGFAMAQVGEAYVYGAAGPSSWDCSGLTMMAWAAAGVSLPHSASMQSTMGTPVSVSALQPGDLVFYYSPVSHVGIYIGNGQLVHAPNPSTTVEVVPVDSMPISGARRVG